MAPARRSRPFPVLLPQVWAPGGDGGPLPQGAAAGGPRGAFATELFATSSGASGSGRTRRRARPEWGSGGGGIFTMRRGCPASSPGPQPPAAPPCAQGGLHLSLPGRVRLPPRHAPGCAGGRRWAGRRAGGGLDRPRQGPRAALARAGRPGGPARQGRGAGGVQTKGSEALGRGGGGLGRAAGPCPRSCRRPRCPPSPSSGSCRSPSAASCPAPWPPPARPRRVLSAPPPLNHTAWGSFFLLCEAVCLTKTRKRRRRRELPAAGALPAQFQGPRSMDAGALRVLDGLGDSSAAAGA